MVCLGLEPRAAGWKAQTNPLSYGDMQFLVSNFLAGQKVCARKLVLLK